MCTNESPSVRGMARLIWAMTVPACLDGTRHGDHRCAERAVAVAVGRRNVDQHGVQGQDPAPEERRRVGQEGRYVFGPALVDRPPGVGADEQGAVEEVAGHLGREVRSGPLDVEVDDLDVLELGCARDECLEQHLGYRRSAMDVDLLAGTYAGDGLAGRKRCAYLSASRPAQARPGRALDCAPPPLPKRSRAAPPRGGCAGACP